jgi:hypothetical protein
MSKTSKWETRRVSVFGQMRGSHSISPPLNHQSTEDSYECWENLHLNKVFRYHFSSSDGTECASKWYSSPGHVVVLF